MYERACACGTIFVCFMYGILYVLCVLSSIVLQQKHRPQMYASTPNTHLLLWLWLFEPCTFFQLITIHGCLAYLSPVVGVCWDVLCPTCVGCVLGVYWVCTGCVLGVYWVCMGYMHKMYPIHIIRHKHTYIQPPPPPYTTITYSSKSSCCCAWGARSSHCVAWVIGLLSLVTKHEPI